MVEEEHTPKSSNSGIGGGGGGGGGGRSSKKLKHKKVPQRGMGVAQLEKIILEEQQKKDVGILTPNSIVSPATSSSSSSCLANIQSVPNFRPPLVPLPPPLPSNHHPLIPRTTDGVNPSFVSKPIHTSSRSWTGGEYTFHGENPNPNPNPNSNPNQNRGLDHRGFTAATAMPTNLIGLPYESNSLIWAPHSNIAQRSQHFQQPCSSSMVNVSLGTTSSSSSSSVMNFQMEPPSNQSYCGNNYPPLWPDEDKMIGMKRSYPFSMENMPIPSFNCKFPFSPISRSDESTCCSNGGTTSLEPTNPSFRENPSSLGAITDQTTKKLIDENRSLTKDFLTLAPPRASPSSLKEKMAPLSGQTNKNPSGGEWSNQQPLPLPLPLHSFFPAAKTPGTSNGEAGEHVDLNLKL